MHPAVRASEMSVYSLSAPAVRPSTSLLCTNAKRMSVGTIVKVATAHTWPQRMRSDAVSRLMVSVTVAVRWLWLTTETMR